MFPTPSDFGPMSTPTATPSSPGPDALARQLRLFKSLALFLAMALLGGVGAFLYIRHVGQPVTVFVNDKPVGTVRNAATANQLIAAAEKAKVGPAYADNEPVRMQKIRLLHAPAGAPQDPDSVVQSKLMQMLTLHLRAYAILVDGHVSVALPTPDAATQTLLLVKDHWADLPPQAEVVGQPEIVETVDIEKRAVDTRVTRPDAASAAPYFWSPPPSKTYQVHRGDLGSRIAHRNHISLTELITANPHTDINHLKPGDILNVQKMPLLLTVRVRKKLVELEKVNPNAPASEAGQQRVTYVTTYINGQETRREAQDVTILEKPLTQMDL